MSIENRRIEVDFSRWEAGLPTLDGWDKNLVGGFKHVLLSIIYGIILPID
jgi:hypothetical protein